MNQRNDLDRLLTSWLDDPFVPPAPRYLGEVLDRTRHTRQRRPWASLERWLPVALVAQRQGTAPVLRPTTKLLLMVLLALAVTAAAVVVGSRLLGPTDPTRPMQALIPTLELDRTLDASTLPGLSQPFGMDIGPDGNLYVVNAGASEILVLAPDGTLVRRWGGPGDQAGEFNFRVRPDGSSIGGVAVGADGAVYVADTMNDRVQQFDAAGRSVRSWGAFGAGDGQFAMPFELATGPDGDVYVVDAQRGDIQRFTSDGQYLATIGSAGIGDGQMSNPGAVKIAPDGSIYLADFDNHRVEAWDENGSFRWSFGRMGAGPGEFQYPNDVALDTAGNLYVVDDTRVQVFDPERRLLSTWVAPTRPTDTMTGVEVADDGTVWVSNRADSLIYRLRTIATTASGSPTPGTPEPTAPAATPSAPSPSPTAERIRIGSVFSVPYTIELPPTWSPQWEYAGGAEVGRLGSSRNSGFVHVIVPINAYADPCRAENGPMSPPLGPSVDDLVSTLTTLPGFRSSPVTDIVIDGRPARTFWLENELDVAGCTANPWLPQVTYDAGDAATCGQRGGSGGTEDCYFGPSSGFHQRIAIVEVNGTRVLIHAYTFTDTPRAELLEVDRVFESVDFD